MLVFYGAGYFDTVAYALFTLGTGVWKEQPVFQFNFNSIHLLLIKVHGTRI